MKKQLIQSWYMASVRHMMWCKCRRQFRTADTFTPSNHKTTRV